MMFRPFALVKALCVPSSLYNSSQFTRAKPSGLRASTYLCSIVLLFAILASALATEDEAERLMVPQQVFLCVLESQEDRPGYGCDSTAVARCQRQGKSCNVNPTIGFLRICDWGPLWLAMCFFNTLVSSIPVCDLRQQKDHGVRCVGLCAYMLTLGRQTFTTPSKLRIWS